MKNLRGQVTIFIIIAIVIVGAVLMFLVLRGDQGPKTSGGMQANTNVFLDTCLEESVREAIDLISIQGGNINPELYKKFEFDGENENPVNITYICYTPNDYMKCVNQESMFFNNLKKEIYNYIKEDVGWCFTELGFELDEQGFEVNSNYNEGDFEIIFTPRSVNVKIDAEMVLTKNEETITQKNFVVNVASKFYELSLIAQKIVNSEAENCDFAHTGHMLFYPIFHIKKVNALDYSTIYRITHSKTQEQFNLAVRGCVIPPGY